MKEAKGYLKHIIHDYFGVDYKLVWKTIQREMPPLKMQVQKILMEGQANNNLMFNGETDGCICICSCFN